MLMLVVRVPWHAFAIQSSLWVETILVESVFIVDRTLILRASPSTRGKPFPAPTTDQAELSRAAARHTVQTGCVSMTGVSEIGDDLLVACFALFDPAAALEALLV